MGLDGCEPNLNVFEHPIFDQSQPVGCSNIFTPKEIPDGLSNIKLNHHYGTFRSNTGFRIVLSLEYTRFDHKNPVNLLNHKN